MFFVIIKMVCHDTWVGCLDIKINMENIRMSHPKRDTPKANLQIVECMNYISISGEIYSEILRQQYSLYSTFSCLLFRYYVEIRRSEWEKDKDFKV